MNNAHFAALNRSTSNAPSAFLNFRRFSEARLQAVLSRKRYSEQGFVEFCRPVPLQVCQLWIVVSNWMPGSPQTCVPSAIFSQQRARVLLLARPCSSVTPLRPPFLSLDGGVHEFVAHADGEIFVLVHHRAVRIAIVAAVVALLDERPCLLLLLRLGLDEILDVGMPVLQRVHLGRAPGLAAGLHHVRHLVVHLQEGERAARDAAAAELLAGGAERGEIAAGARAVLEEHRLAGGQAHDVLHRVVDGLDEAGAPLRVFILGFRALGLAGAVVVKVISFASTLADMVLVPEAHVEPDRRIERSMLVHAKPGQLVVESLRGFFIREIAVLDPAIGDGARHAVDELAHTALAAALVRIVSVGDIAIKIL